MHIPEGAVDLAQIKERADKRDAEAEQKEIEAAQVRAQTWDRNMQRAFKGIVPRPVRRRYLQRALVRYNEEHPNDR